MKAFGLARLGRDAEIRTTSQGESVATLALAFSYGRKGSDGNRPTQWVDAALWGKRAEALAPYLLKGGLVSVSLEDVHIETFDGKNGPGHKLAARVVDLELASPKQAGAAPAPRQTPAPRPAPAPSGGHGFEEMDSDIPFMDALKRRSVHLVM
jgi:single-strand DNA-binding protein